MKKQFLFIVTLLAGTAMMADYPATFTNATEGTSGTPTPFAAGWTGTGTQTANSRIYQLLNTSENVAFTFSAGALTPPGDTDISPDTALVTVQVQVAHKNTSTDAQQLTATSDNVPDQIVDLAAGAANGIQTFTVKIPENGSTTLTLTGTSVAAGATVGIELILATSDVWNHTAIILDNGDGVSAVEASLSITNPVSEKLDIFSNELNDAVVSTITDLNGNIVLKSVGKSINTSALASGMYVLSLDQYAGVYRKFIVE